MNHVTLTRRYLLKGSAGLVGVSILNLGATAVAHPRAGSVTEAELSGRAAQRIDGLDKVTGRKIFARDFNAKDMKGWPKSQWYALFLRATTTERTFLGVDLASLPVEAHPTRIVFGDELDRSQRSPPVAINRGVHFNAIKTDNFDNPAGLMFDLVVERGRLPDFLGQAVALLLFSERDAYRLAKSEMQFRDKNFLIYGNAEVPLDRFGQVYRPETHYVYFKNRDAVESSFSYAQVGDLKEYKKDKPRYQAKIESFLAEHPSLLLQRVDCSMQATDPMFMEPESGLAWFDHDDEKLHLVLGTQSPDADVEAVNAMFASPDSPVQLSSIALTSCYPGGGFGGRDSSPFSPMLALAASQSRGNPVRLAYDRFEQFRVGLKRHACTVSGELAVDPEQKIKAVKMELTFDGGGRRNLSPWIANLAALCAGGSYDIPMADVHAKSIRTKNVAGGSQRGFGGPQAFFAIETALDEIARDRGWDPIVLRRKNLLTRGDRTIVGGPVEQDLRLEELLDIAEAHPAWSRREELKARYSVEGRAYGTGLAMSLQAYGTSGDGVVGGVSIDQDGSLVTLTNAVDMGNGSATTLSVVVAESLGRNASRIEMGDSALFKQIGLRTTSELSKGKRASWDNPQWTAGSVGSSSACLTAFHQVHVVRQAAKVLFLESVLPAARRLWDLPDLAARDTRWVDGTLTLRRRWRRPLSIGEIARHITTNNLSSGVIAHAFFQSRWAEADFPLTTGITRLPLDGLALRYPDRPDAQVVLRRNTQGPPEKAHWYSRTVWAPCVNIIGVSVDTVSGDTVVEKAVTILNAGRPLVPELVSGQSQGGLAMAIGFTLFEGSPSGIDGPAGGKWNLNRYRVPLAGDLPLAGADGSGGQELILLPPTAGRDHAARGIAEAVICSVAPAISNAIRDAIGHRFTSLPITAEVIRQRL